MDGKLEQKVRNDSRNGAIQKSRNESVLRFAHCAAEVAIITGIWAVMSSFFLTNSIRLLRCARYRLEKLMITDERIPAHQLLNLKNNPASVVEDPKCEFLPSIVGFRPMPEGE
jgi:hypothetical protein